MPITIGGTDTDVLSELLRLRQMRDAEWNSDTDNQRAAFNSNQALVNRINSEATAKANFADQLAQHQRDESARAQDRADRLAAAAMELRQREADRQQHAEALQQQRDFANQTAAEKLSEQQAGNDVADLSAKYRGPIQNLDEQIKAAQKEADQYADNVPPETSAKLQALQQQKNDLYSQYEAEAQQKRHRSTARANMLAGNAPNANATPNPYAEANQNLGVNPAPQYEGRDTVPPPGAEAQPQTFTDTANAKLPPALKLKVEGAADEQTAPAAAGAEAPPAAPAGTYFEKIPFLKHSEMAQRNREIDKREASIVSLATEAQRTNPALFRELMQAQNYITSNRGSIVKGEKPLPDLPANELPAERAAKNQKIKEDAAAAAMEKLIEGIPGLTVEQGMKYIPEIESRMRRNWNRTHFDPATGEAPPMPEPSPEKIHAEIVRMHQALMGEQTGAAGTDFSKLDDNALRDKALAAHAANDTATLMAIQAEARKRKGQ